MLHRDQILIVGMGPVGLTLAIMLTMLNIKCRIIDKRDTSSQALRSILISKETEDIFATIGVIKAIREKALAVPSMLVNHYSEGVMELDYVDTKQPHPYFSHIYQPDIEAILAARLKELDIKVDRGFELISLDNLEQSVKVKIKRLSDAAVEESYYEYLVGCDGVNSTVRKLVNIGCDEVAYNKSFILADVLVPKVEHMPHTSWHVHETGYLSIIPSTGDRIRIIQSVEPNDENLPLTPEILEKLLQQKAQKKIKIQDIIWVARSRFRHNIAQNGQKNRVFLAGDAYHIFSPIGGVNMNFGISDAKALSVYISSALIYKQKLTILGGYEKERNAEISKMLQYTALLSKMMTRPKQCKKLWKLFFSLYKNEPSFKKNMMLRISGLATDLY
jgi:2-polyprenyl-6-methoxyphenol hydroxylase-like FAD-dependent oxidoreductase